MPAAHLVKNVLRKATEGLGVQHFAPEMGSHRRTARIGLTQKIGDHDHHRAVRQNLVEKIEGPIGIGAREFCFEEENIADHPKHVASPLGRRHEFLDRLGEEQQSHLVLIADGRKSDDRCQLGHQSPLGLLA